MHSVEKREIHSQGTPKFREINQQNCSFHEILSKMYKCKSW